MTGVVQKVETNESLQQEMRKVPENPSARAVFSEGKSDTTLSLEQATHPIRSELETLYRLQALNPTEERAKKMVDLERQRGRVARFTMLQTKGVGTPEQIADQKKILEGKDSLEKLKASDILLLKRKGVDLANLLLVPVGVDPTKSTTCDFIEKGDHANFIVNFGESKNINNVIGAGDILPPTVNRIKINGVEGERKYVPRPGYYDIKTGKYLPIYDGDKLEVVKVVKIGEMDEKSIKEASEAGDKWFHDRRIEDMIDNGGKALSDLPEDRKLEEEAQKEIEEMKKRREKYRNYSPESKNRFLETFGEVIDRETSRYGIPKDMLVNNLFEKENASFNPFLKNRDSSAYGFGQIIDGTWKSISYRLGVRLDRENPEDQIIATCEYLSYIKNLRNCSWGEAIVYYHTGENFGDRHVRTAMAVNAPIAKRMQDPENPTAHDYVTAAAKYYGVTEYMSV